MRDPKLLLSLLKEMKDEPIGKIHIGSDGRGEAIRFHHSELLVDAGHAAWCNSSKSMLRITESGYKFSESVEPHPEAKLTFQELLEQGASYATAVEKAMEIVQKLKDLIG